LDAVLSEVSRAFGTASGHAAPLAALAEDTINDHLVDLTADQQAAPAPADRPQPDVPLETAADLFRAPSPVAEPPQAAASEPQPPSAEIATEPIPAQPVETPREVALEAPAAEKTEAETAPAPTATAVESSAEADALPSTGAASDSAPASPAPVAKPVASHPSPAVKAEEPQAAPLAPVAVAPPTLPSLATRILGGPRRGLGLLRNVESRLPQRARFAAAVVVALIVGAIGGAILGRSSAGSAAGESSRSASQTGDEASSEDAAAEQAKVAALEEQLETAKHDREVAQHEIDQARQRLTESNVLLRTQQQTDAARQARDEAARKQAVEDFQKAQERLHLTEWRAYDAQLARVRDCWQRNPGLAAALLEDPNGCPHKLRDFAWGYFYGRSKHDRATWAGTTPAKAVAWSPDGTVVASAGRDGSITLRDAATGNAVASLAGHAGGVNSLAFSQHGERLVSAGADGTVKLWEVASRHLEATFFGHLGAVLCVAIAPDSSALVSGGDDGTLRFWDVANRRVVATRWGHPRNHEPEDGDDPTRFVRAVTFSPDGRLVASGGYQVVRIWDADANEKSTLNVADGSVSALAFSPDSMTLAIGSEGTIALRDVDSLVVRSGPQPVDAPVICLAFSTDGAWLAAATGDRALIFDRIARAADGEGQQKETAAKQRPESSRYDLANPRRLTGHNGLVSGITFAPGGEQAATCGADGTIRLWDARGKVMDERGPDVVLRDVPRASALAYSPDSRCLAIGAADSIRLWDMRGGVEVARLANRTGDVTRLGFSPDGRHLASAGRDWPILIWTLSNQRIELALNGHTAGVNALGYSTDGKTVISASDDGTLRLWNAANGQAIASLTENAGPVLSAALSPDGKLAAAGGADHKVRLWSVEGKHVIATLAGHAGPVVALAFSPDGRCLLSAEGRQAESGEVRSNGATPLRLWQLPEAKELLAFGPAEADVRDVAFSPDSKTLATSGPKGVTLWDPRTGEIRESLRPVSSTASAPDETLAARSQDRLACPVAFSPDGQSLAVGGSAALNVWLAAPFSSSAVARAATP
jgi:WD40 repeat protein